VSESNGILALQTLGEFFNACVRKYRFDPQVMQAAVASWQEVFPIAVSSPSALNAAMRAVISHSLSFWDAMLVSTVREAGVSLLFSEDMQHGQVIEVVRIINPFA
jgi:predicted nucleic acid-binding protein